MCGIAGILELDRSASAKPETLRGMSDALWHRGPDDAGIFVAGNVGLVHRRLSIIDLGGGHQPLFNEDRSAVIVFNGEIYNYAELAKLLAARGHRFATRSDTETIVHGYDEWGEGVVDALRGMFAFALWDLRQRRLLLARDRLGIKPLYYYQGRDFLAFASEIKALLEDPRVPRELDLEALDLYLSLRYVPGPRTAFRGIRKLEPGHLLVCDQAGVRVQRYWDLPLVDPSPQSAIANQRRLLEVLEESVRLHLVSEVPLGVFLSGGLDSTAVLALMARAEPHRRPSTFTVGYRATQAEEEAANEFSFARLAASHCRAEHHELELSADDFRDFLPDLIWHLDEPVADPACVPLFYISRRAREKITVVLSGEGADEILGGYGIYRRMLQLERGHRLLGRPLGSLFPALSRLVPAQAEKARHYARLVGLPLAARYRGVSRAFLTETKGALLGCFDHERLERGTREVFAGHFAARLGEPPLEQMLYADIKTWLADDLLVKADKMTMANGQELRVPFLDHRVVELAASLPTEAKIRGRTGKAALRDAMTGLVPAPILERSKKGFPVPTGPVLRRLGDFGRDVLLDRSSACRSLFDVGAVERLLDEHERGERSRDQEIWSLLVLEFWHGVFLDRRFQPSRRWQPALQAVAPAV
jgi:asparagine synthase (glutamine-hydrolysing)